jgi:hypothetical protein
VFYRLEAYSACVILLDGDFLKAETKRTDTVFPLSEVKLLPPVNPGKMIAIGLN